MHRFTASHRARAQVLWGEVKKQFPSDIPYEVVREEVLRRLTEEEERRTRREAMESLSPGIVADEEENSPPAKRPCSRCSSSPLATRRGGRKKKVVAMTPLRSHRIEEQEGYMSDVEPSLWLLPAVPPAVPASPSTKKHRRGDHTIEARLTILSWNLGSEIQLRRFQRDVSAIAEAVNAAWARARARGAGLVVAFQEFELGPKGPLRTHRLLSLPGVLDDGLEWADREWLDTTDRQKCEALLVSKGAIEVVATGHDDLKRDNDVYMANLRRKRKQMAEGYRVGDGTGVAPDPKAARAPLVLDDGMVTGRNLPWAELKVRPLERGDDTSLGARRGGRGGRGGAPRATVKIASCHLRAGDKEMRKSARAWLRATGREEGVVAAILAGDFNDDLTEAGRADSPYAQSMCRVLWPKRAMGPYERCYDYDRRRYDPRTEARLAGFDANGWAWGSYHGYHGELKNFVNKGRIIDGAMCFGTSESVRCDGARLVTDGFDGLSRIHEDAHDELQDALRYAPSDHFPVQTDLTLTYLATDDGE